MSEKSNNNLNMFHCGMIMPFLGNTPPESWLFCDGTTFDPTAYPELAALLGQIHNEYRTPNFIGRTLIGSSQNGQPDTTNNTNQSEKYTKFPDDIKFIVKETCGEYQHKLTSNEIPAHTHNYAAYKFQSVNLVPNAGYGGYYTCPDNALFDANLASTSVGGDMDHYNMQPSFVVNYIIFAGNKNSN